VAHGELPPRKEVRNEGDGIFKKIVYDKGSLFSEKNDYLVVTIGASITF